jgi:hypothetical protein
MFGVVADEKLSDFWIYSSILNLSMYALMMTVFAVPCSPINKAAFKMIEFN